MLRCDLRGQHWSIGFSMDWVEFGTLNRRWSLKPLFAFALFVTFLVFSTGVWAQEIEPPNIAEPANFNLFGAGALLLAMVTILGSILTSHRLHGSSLFNRLFIVVAVTSGFFSALRSAIGFSLITSQENDDFLRNVIMPPAFGVFVFFLAVAIWVGGAEFVRRSVALRASRPA